ncbi:actin filament-associated protein 1 isoform X1 [Lates japonicus]|uniref:Actin filament-associated protein 1 isoform X1 n=1 Tax=Lates japonicus TaxID=270547 RepID=A0AAD3N8P7_LATJO|nr:actin filament-associated protein 1 isoform X1 [Lates japonicus]
MRSDPVLFTSSRAMEELVCELRLFLDLLDREYLSAGVREKKMHLSNILHRVLSDKDIRRVRLSLWPELIGRAFYLSEIHSGLPAPPSSDALPEIPHPSSCKTSNPSPRPITHNLTEPPIAASNPTGM